MTHAPEEHAAPGGTRRVALLAGAGFYVGPELARLLAAEHDLVLGDPLTDMVPLLEGAGAAVEVVSGVRDLADPQVSRKLVAAGLDRFGRLDAACAFSGRIVTGRFLDATLDNLRAVLSGCVEAPFHFLQAVLPPMLERGEGQVLVITSASAVRPTPGAPLYSAARAGATMLVKNVAAEFAQSGVQVNAVGSNFMDFPEFRRATRIEGDPERRRAIEAMVPMQRLGTMEEFAHFCMPFLDGKSRFTTGQFVAYAGGWA
jgi:NAD(P)-dependent dehydrogenase (short-subunit alcohol dehydrogenase family)